MREWLEVQLAEVLRPSAAPPDLWDRVWEPRPQPRRRVTAWAVWPIAAALALAIPAGIAWFQARKGPSLDLRHLALEQLREAAPLDFQSSDPAEISRWLRQQTGADVRLPSRRAVRLLGARVIRTVGTPVGAVVYRVGDSDATLLVARTSDMADTSHRRFSWSAGGLTYALACANEAHPEAACLLCHASL